VSLEHDSQGNTVMKRFLKDGQSGLFFDGKGGWTADESAAVDFKDSSEAIRAFQKLGKEDIFLVLKFEDARFDIATPLNGITPPPKHINPQNIIISTFLPVAFEAVRAVSTRI
jgi:hypothetical protein